MSYHKMVIILFIFLITNPLNNMEPYLLKLLWLKLNKLPLR